MAFMDRVEVASPCPASWDAMDGTDQVRFCGQCRMNVYNFSEMTEAEAQTLIETTEGRVCGRFYRRADGTVITKDCPVGLAALRKRVAALGASIAAGLALMLGLFGWRSAQASEIQERAPRRLPTVEVVDSGPDTVEPDSAVTPVTPVTPNPGAIMGRVAIQPPACGTTKKPPRVKMGKIAVRPPRKPKKLPVRPQRFEMGEVMVAPPRKNPR